MQKINVTVTKQNGVSVIRYDMLGNEVYDEMAANKAASLPNILAFQFGEEMGNRTITAYQRTEVTLKSYLLKPRKKIEMLRLLKSISDIFMLGMQGIPIPCIVKDIENMFVDEATITAKAVLIPVKGMTMAAEDVADFFRVVISNAIYDEHDSDNYVAQILNKINAPDFNAFKINEGLTKMLDEAGYDPNATTESAKANKVNKFAVMQQTAANQYQQEQQMYQQQMAMQQQMYGQQMYQQPMMGQPVAPQMMQQPQMGMPMGQPMYQQPAMQPVAPQDMTQAPQMMDMSMNQAPQMGMPMGQPMYQQPAMQPVAPQMDTPVTPEMTAPVMDAAPVTTEMPVPPTPDMTPVAGPEMPEAVAPEMAAMPEAPMPEASAPMPEAPVPMPEAPAPMPEASVPMQEAPVSMQEVPVPMPEAPVPEAPAPAAPEFTVPDMSQVSPMGQQPMMQNPQMMGQPVAPQAQPTMNVTQAVSFQPEVKDPAPQPVMNTQQNTIPQTMGALINQVSSLPTPHLVRVKSGEEINITKPEFNIGKDPNKCDYAVTDNKAVSRTHCTIIQRDGVNFIRDNGSTNHTYINEVEIAPNNDVLLKHNTKIHLGDEEFLFKLRKGE